MIALNNTQEHIIRKEEIILELQKQPNKIILRKDIDLEMVDEDNERRIVFDRKKIICEFFDEQCNARQTHYFYDQYRLFWSTVGYLVVLIQLLDEQIYTQIKQMWYNPPRDALIKQPYIPFIPRENINPQKSKLEGIISKSDDRMKVDVKMHPHHKCVGFLQPILRDKTKKCFATAFLIGPNTILTAAHNITLDKNIESFYFYPSVYGEINIPDASCEPVKVVSWKYDKDFDLQREKQKIKSYKKDFAVMILERNVYLDEYPSFIFLDKFKDAKIEIIGYPAEKQHRGARRGEIIEPFFGEGQISSAEECVIYYTVNTSAGQSGSPIFIRVKGHIYIIGIHNAYSSTQELNRGVYITEDILHLIKKWRNDLLQSYRPAEKDHKPHAAIKYEDFYELSQLMNECPLNNLTQFFQFHWNITAKNENIFTCKYAQLTRVGSKSLRSTQQFIISQQCFQPKRKSVVRFEVGSVKQSMAIGIVRLNQNQNLDDESPTQIYKFFSVGYKIYRNEKGQAKRQIFPLGNGQRKQSYKYLVHSEPLTIFKGDIYGFEVDPLNQVVRFYENNQFIFEFQIKVHPQSKLYLMAVLGNVGDSIYINRLS